MTRSRTDRPIWSRAVAVCVVALCLIGATSSAAAAVPGLMLARDLGATRIDVDVYFVSEKLDGVRGRWDGQALWTRV